MLARSITLATNILFVLIINFALRTNSAQLDFCQTVGNIDNSTTVIYVNTSIIQNQINCAQYFEVDLNSTLLEQSHFLFFELSFTTFPDSQNFLPLLLARKNHEPSYSLGTSMADFVDTNAWRNRKHYHSIAIDLKNLTNTDKIYFGVYQSALSTTNYVNFPINYEVKLSSSSLYPCPQACSGNGFCSYESQQCICSDDYFDIDCSIKATKMVLKTAAQQSINPNTWGYFYFPIKDFSDNMEIDLQKDTGIIDYSFLFDQKFDYTIPNSYNSDGKYHLSLSKTQGKLMVEDNNLAPHLNDVLLVGAFNNYTEPISAQITIKSYNNSSIIRTVSMYLMIAISIVLVLAWLFVTVFKYKSHTQMEALLRNYQTEREQEKVLNKKDINKYFPKAKFQELKSGFSQNMCSVCLEDFEGESNCRQLYCEHIYHGECIEAWLAQHYNCPNCKKDMTKLAIEEALKQKAKQQEQEKDQILAENLDDKRHKINENILKQPPLEEVKEIHPAKVDVTSSKRNENINLEEGADDNGSPEQTNLLRSSSIVPLQTNEFHILTHKPNSTLSKPESVRSNRSHHESGHKDYSINGSEDGIARSETYGRRKNVRKPSHQTPQKINNINLEPDVQAVKLEG